MEKLSISSFIKNGHEFHLYVYGQLKDAPPSTCLKDANEILSSDRIFKHQNLDTYSTFSNIFRYKLLLEKGGYWADTDVVCLRPLDFQQDYIFAEEEILKAKRICGNVIKTPPGSEIMRHCFEKSTDRDPKDLYWNQIGPELVTSAVQQFSMQQNVQPYRVFNPINWWHWQDFLRDDAIARLRINWRFRKNPHTVHLWNEMWRRNGADKNASFPAGSLYEQLKRKYL